MIKIPTDKETIYMRVQNSNGSEDLTHGRIPLELYNSFYFHRYGKLENHVYTLRNPVFPTEHNFRPGDKLIIEVQF